MTGQRWGQPQVYEIRIVGHLGATSAQMFEGFELVREPGGDTVLTGPVVDQAALYGALNRIRDLGVPLISVSRLEPSCADTEASVL